MLKRELESVKRELRNLKTGQHENTRENVEGEMTGDERITRERTGLPTCDPRCETCESAKQCQRIRERQLRKLHTSTLQQ